jgi:hypothetical protein
MRPIDEALVADIEAAWAIDLTQTQRDELLEFLLRDLPSINEREQRSPRRRGAPRRTGLRRFLFEFALHLERAGGYASGGWNKDGSRVVGQYAAALRVVWEAVPDGKGKPRDVEQFARFAIEYAREWKVVSLRDRVVHLGRQSPARAAYILRKMHAWRK